ncbi:unnamed protein product [Prorocentrum cordatum]|uniref:Uncharacterized protein n=1 Tax=Prorocentrum cordatum TaxID=2364126 RepID=A0ABN9R228_9DINO|nr:unnamed protein product [Polarella glacialis]
MGPTGPSPRASLGPTLQCSWRPASLTLGTIGAVRSAGLGGLVLSEVLRRLPEGLARSTYHAAGRVNAGNDFVAAECASNFLSCERPPAHSGAACHSRAQRPIFIQLELAGRSGAHPGEGARLMFCLRRPTESLTLSRDVLPGLGPTVWRHAARARSAVEPPPSGRRPTAEASAHGPRLALPGARGEEWSEGRRFSSEFDGPAAGTVADLVHTPASSDVGGRSRGDGLA